MGACFCTGACQRPPYRCAAGDFSKTYDPDYETKIARRAVMNYILSQQKGRKSPPSIVKKTWEDHPFEPIEIGFWSP